MPFYLVTHTSLVEADNEKSAAQTAIAKVQSGGRFKVTVKSDEATTAHFDIEAWPKENCAISPPFQEPADESGSGTPPVDGPSVAREAGVGECSRLFQASRLGMTARLVRMPFSAHQHAGGVLSRRRALGEFAD